MVVLPTPKKVFFASPPLSHAKPGLRCGPNMGLYLAQPDSGLRKGRKSGRTRDILQNLGFLPSNIKIWVYLKIICAQIPPNTVQ